MYLNRIPFRQLKPMLATLQTSCNMALTMTEDQRSLLAAKTVAAHEKTVALLKDNPTRPQVIGMMCYYWLLMDEWATHYESKIPDFSGQLQGLRQQCSWLGRVIEWAKTAQGERVDG